MTCSDDSECTVVQCCVDGFCEDMECTDRECGPDSLCGIECGQCPLGTSCDDSTFRCVECISDCDDNNCCDYGQLCDLGTHSCYDDDRGPYCEQCTNSSIYQPSQCGSGPNFCLVSGGDLAAPLYCGVDCSDHQPCPNGYECRLVLFAYTNDTCRADDECDSGVCEKKQGEEWGFCLCTRDDECPQDSCDDFAMECRITRRPCAPGGRGELTAER